MRKMFVITLIASLLILTFTQLAVAQDTWKENKVTNQTSETLHVVFSTWRVASGNVPETGYRTVGYYNIPPNGSKKFYGYQNNPIYLQIQTHTRDPIKPQKSTATLRSWLPNSEKRDGFVFNIVTPVFGTATPAQISFTSIPKAQLSNEDGFIKYRNGSQIGVTNTWVNVNTPPPGEGPVAPDDGVDKPSLAQEVFDTYSETLQREDIQTVLPQVLEEMKTPLFQTLLTPEMIMNFVETPNLLQGLLPAIDIKFVTLLGTDEALQALFSDPQMQTVLQDTEAIDELIELLTGGAATDDPVNVPDSAVNIPDPGLRYAITEALNVPENASITRTQMKSLRVLDDGQLLEIMEFTTLDPIQDLTGLEFAINLTELDFAGHSISDVSPLARLRKLDWLNLSGNNISDVSPLANLTRLYWLDLSYNNISDVSALAKLVKLEELDLSDNPITDAAPLADLKKGGTVIIGVSISYGNTVNIPDPNLRRVIANTLNKPQNTPIAEADMAGLTALEAVEQSITDLTGLGSAINLEKLDLSGNNISDISPLENLTKLKRLDLSDNNISNISPLAKLSVFGLDLSGNNISDISPLENLANLSDLDLSRNAISDVSLIANWNLARWRNLEWLSLSDNNISNISPLENLGNVNSPLYYLDLSNNNISDISPLAKLGNLVGELKLGGNPITNVAPLIGLRDSGIEIEGVSFDTPVEDISADTPVNIPDPNLYRVIAKQLNIPENTPITQGDMKALTSLEAIKQSITDLTGLEAATNLESMDLSDNIISDVSALAALVNLTELYLNNNVISDVSALATLVNLTGLYLDNNAISDVSALTALVNLRMLDLRDNPITDVTPLVGLRNNGTAIMGVSLGEPVAIPDSRLRWGIETALRKPQNAPITQGDMEALTKLEISPVVSDLTGLEFATNLVTLRLNGISDVSPLENLVNLEELSLNWGGISDVSLLKNLVKLEKLHLNGNDISDVSPLKNLVKLEELELEFNDISDVSPLKNLVNLKTLDLTGNTVSDVSPLENLINLTYLDLWKNPITDATPLAGLQKGGTVIRVLFIPNDDEVNIPDPNLRSVIAKQLKTPITQGHMKRLTHLSAIGHSIRDLTGLEFATNLEILPLSDNNISDVSPLENLVKLEKLWLRNNNISDVSPPENLVNLKTLNLNGNAISDVSPLENLVNLIYLDIRDNPITDATPLTGLKKNGTRIIDDSFDEPVNIPDPNLRSAIRTQRKIPGNAPITYGSMSHLTSLGHSKSITDVSDLTGLEFATNLVSLRLSRTNLSDLSPLENLVNLEVLYVHGTGLSDLSPLENLVNLRQLGVFDPGLSDIDISPLANLVKLETLNLRNNDISDVSSLENLVKLKTLRLQNNNISDVSPLENLVKLEELHLNDNNISDVSPLENLVKLEELHLNDNNISDVSPLENLVNLQLLYLGGNPITDATPLIGLVDNGALIDGVSVGEPFDIPDPVLRNAIRGQLKRQLRLSDNTTITQAHLKRLTGFGSQDGYFPGPQLAGVSDLTGLEFATNLVTLNLATNLLSDLSPLANLVNLKELKLEGGAFSDISFLANLVNLRKLELKFEGGAFSDISPLTNMVNLQVLSLNNNAISDISPLADLVQLTHLFLSNNSISDISPLAKLVELEDLDLSNNAISDISPLANLVNLWELYLANNNISDLSGIPRSEDLRDLDLSDNPIRDLTHLMEFVKFVGDRVLHLEINNLKQLDREQYVELLHYRYPKYRKRFQYPSNLGITFRETGDSCGTDMSTVSERLTLSPVRVEVKTEPFRIRSDAGGFSYATPKAAVPSSKYRLNKNFVWEIYDTVADNSDELYSGSVIITVELLRGPKDEAFSRRTGIKNATDEWADAGNLRFRIIDEDDGKPSDIRVQILPEAPSAGESNVGAPELFSPEAQKAYWRSNERTMYIRSNAGYGTILHEFGHALGLTHEHLSPTFLEYFKWNHEGDERYLAVMNAFQGYSDYDKSLFQKSDDQLTRAEKERKTELKDGINNNYFDIREIDVEKSHFDIDSVMTYGLNFTLIDIVDAAPPGKENEFQHIKEVFNDEGGIPHNRTKLSHGDKEFIANCYGVPHERAEISGTITIKGQDCDLGIFKCLVSETFGTIDNIVPYTVTGVRPGEDYHARLIKKYTWGDDCRVEIHIGTREIKDDKIEVAVYVPFYQQDGKAKTTTDLDDIECKTFTLDLIGAYHEVKIKVVNENKFVKLGTGNDTCDVAGLNTYQDGVQGDIQSGGFDWAEVTLKIRAGDRSVYVPAAPSAIIANQPIALKRIRRTLLSDINSDGLVDITDLLLVSKHLGQTAPTHLNVDINADGIVTITDLVQVAQFLGQSQDGASAPTRFVAPPEVTYAMVEEWIRQARLADDGSSVFKQGIANLEYLLILMIPEETALLTNYPNPFNPETWIPYHLATHADVTLTIYAADGTVVRHLDLGHQEAGYYQNKARAAYWDGRNAVGERVASGVYFYTLTAGDFAATRKMLILK